ncbi:potassium-transporting ATPase KdpC subunit [Cypionkella aquatica]|uniref:Potassium-transporting ATPase KdpC subunit n=1 Tax=Cypionkella aquatica TaxID=1756042 RepID=A0AA37TZ30_9RHOB|nr:potassium-transporting ATPase subunit KdpC [Cypionkella aquatica]GLS85591.1 potassium-transporting ATPase KdpC subunit [Cypionkella aquatica]
MLTHLRPAVVLLAAFTLLLGVAYPLAITGVAQAAFPDQANGSQIALDGKVIGSDLIGQSFASPGYFHSRPSAVDYNAAGSSGSNLGPLSQQLLDRVAGDVAGRVAVPADAVTTSASGLDPHISPANAAEQIARVAAARKVTPDQLAKLVADHTEQPMFGLIGEPRVNVLRLNLALDKIAVN